MKSDRLLKTIVCIPAFNEEGAIGDLIKKTLSLWTGCRGVGVFRTAEL